MPLLYLPLRASPANSGVARLFLNTAKREDVWYAAVTNEQGKLVACSFSNDRKAAEKSAINSLPRVLRRDLVPSPRDPATTDILHRIYLGEDYDHLPSIALVRPSKFLKDVYKATMRIPKGKVTTYGRLARLVGSKRRARAVGNAMARNPLPLIVPCHRVVPSTLRVGNYGGGGTEKGHGGRVKRGLLLREDVQFDGDRIKYTCVWEPS